MVITKSIDKDRQESLDTQPLTSIDTDQPEAGKFSKLTSTNNWKATLGKSIVQSCNAISQIMKEQGTAIPVEIHTTFKNEKELSLQEFSNPSRTYSNRSAIKLPEIETIRSKLNIEHLVLVR